MALALASCSTDTDTTNRPLFPDGYNVLQATVTNGLTGEPIDNVNLRVQVGRDTLDDEIVSSLHMIYGIPNATEVFVLADAEGYSPFIAKVTLTGTGNIQTGDYAYHFRNVLMYPVGTTPRDIQVSVYQIDGTPVDGATVVLTLSAASVFVPVETALQSGVGILPNSLVQVTANGGKAVFPASGLIFGGTYSIDVFGALDANGVFLQPSQNSLVTVGVNVPEVVVFLDKPVLVPVAATTNTETAGERSTLVINFPYAVDKCTSTGWWVNNNCFDEFPPVFIHACLSLDTDIDGYYARPHASASVTEAFSNGNTTLTLNYVTNEINDATAAFDAQDNLWVFFGGTQVKPRGASDSSCTPIQLIELRNTDDFINTEINANIP